MEMQLFIILSFQPANAGIADSDILWENLTILKGDDDRLLFFKLIFGSYLPSVMGKRNKKGFTAFSTNLVFLL